MDLKEFLEKEGAWRKFCANVYTLSEDAEPENSFLMCAFTWAASPEGHEYWFNLNTKYEEEAKNTALPDFGIYGEFKGKTTLRLKEHYGDITLVAVDDDGDVVPGNYIVRISKKGVHRYMHVNDSLGFDTEAGRIKED